MRHRQQGMTLIGILCILGLVGTVLYGGIRIAPLYLNYMKVARSLDATAEESKGENPDPGAIRHLLDRHWQLESIDGVKSDDVEITKDEGGVEMHVVYDDSAPFIANVSLAVHFDKTVKVQ